ncbi:MAG: right-handed parallel beta-helix repeat-containing protein [Candidatus Sulfotelmatobacter sp.]
MYRKIGIILLQCAPILSQVTDRALLKSSPDVNNICVVDGLKYGTIQSAITGCSGTGAVAIPPTYVGNDWYQNPNDVTVWDFRRSERVKGLTAITDFGARGDAVTETDGASQSGSATFTSPSASFVPGRDEGKAIVITGAGADNASLTTTIRAVNSSVAVALAVAASFTATDLNYWYGTENTSAFQGAYKSRKPLFLPAGKYLMTGTVKGSIPLFLTGAGKQSIIIDDTTVFELHGTGGHFLDNLQMQAATKLTAVSPSSFPTPHAGTTVAVDRIGAGIGYQPQLQDGDIWAKVSQAQRSQQLGPTITISSDGTHIYRITGDLVSILLFDVEFSEVALCDFRAGKNFVGGLVLWHTPNDGRVNRQDKIHDNHVQYASYSGIVWTASESVSVSHNRTEYNGESGLKNYASQDDGTYNTSAEVVGNDSQHSHYDGLDLSQDYPHTNKQRASSIASGNTSSFNDRTGAYVDGLGWTLADNVFENNGLSGMSLDVSDSVISGNTLTHNNTLHEANSHQMLVGPGTAAKNNVIEHNRIVGIAAAGAAIKWSTASTGNKIMDNTAKGGAVFDFGVAPIASHGNSDSRGPYPDK